MSARSPLDLLVTHAALTHLVQTPLEVNFVDHLLDTPDAASIVKNVCAKVSVDLSNEIDAICNFLGISKRKFIEAALIEAVAKANAIMKGEGLDYSLKGGE